MSDFDTTRRSWNNATRNHNAHKGDQAALLRSGADVLFPEELELLGELTGKRLVHLQCNAGQDSLGLARRGATVHGVDLSDEAVAFARRLSQDSGVPATFERSELLSWLATTDRRFQVAFTSYGATGWLPDLDGWARGVARVLEPGGSLVYVEFHPLVWSVGETFGLDRDDYFTRDTFHEPVSDYVRASGSALGVVEVAEVLDNDVPAVSWQWTLAEIVDAIARAGLRVERLREYPYANGCLVHPRLVATEGRRWAWPDGVAKVPLMFGLRATKD
jgi:SAM-dependent methyltransferase